MFSKLILITSEKRDLEVGAERISLVDAESKNKRKQKF